MNIEDITVFLTIADTLNLSKAAELMYITQSTVSYRLKRLEDELGICLVKRNRGERYVELTPKGTEFIGIAKQWVSIAKYTKQFKETQNFMNLRIAQVDWFNAYPFYEFYESFLEAEPQVKIKVRTGHSFPISEKVNNVETDVGFVVHPNRSPQLVYQPIFQDPLVMVCSKDAGRTGDTVYPGDLDAQDEVLWRYFGDMRLWYEQWLWHEQWWDSSIIPAVQIDFSVPTAFGFLSNPKRWMVSPKSIAEDQVQKNSNLAIYEFSSPPPNMVCYCIYRNEPSQQAIASINVLLNHMEKHSDILIKHDYMKI